MTHIVLPSVTTTPTFAKLPPGVTDLRSRPDNSRLALTRAADLAGLAGVVVPDRVDDPASFVVAAQHLRASRYVEVVVGFASWIATPHYVAKLSASLQRFSGDRLGWHLAADDPGASRFVEAAQDFWHSSDGLKSPLGDALFPAVYIGDNESFQAVGHDPGEVYRLGEELS
jgi:hypothetical protein